MIMVVTLKSGVQIRAEVNSFTTERGRAGSDLRRLKWDGAEGAAVLLSWLDLEEVAAVHGEREAAEEPGKEEGS